MTADISLPLLPAFALLLMLLLLWSCSHSPLGFLHHKMDLASPHRGRRRRETFFGSCLCHVLCTWSNRLNSMLVNRSVFDTQGYVVWVANICWLDVRQGNKAWRP